MNRKMFFFATISFLGFILTITLLIYFENLNSTNDIISVVSSFIVVSINLIIGISSFKRIFTGDNKKFMINFFGSMFIRMMFMLIFVLISVALIKFPRVPLVFSFFGFYLFALIFEIYYLSVITKKIQLR
jgi:hypothetical protein